MSRKKHSIFQLFIIPLIFIVVSQALLTYWTIYSSGTLDLIDESAVSTLSQTVSNRKIILENNMIQRWSRVDEEAAVLNGQVQRLLEGRGITMEEFLSNPQYQQEFLQETTSTCLYAMRKNGVTGAFVVLANEKTGKEAVSLEGMYFRDQDPLSNPANYSDVLMERGRASFSHELKIPLDSLWKQRFQLEPAGSREADEFFFKPYMAALEHPDIGFSNLGYWSRPFCLEGNVAEDSNRILSYSVPLIYKGSVYGVMGIDISVPYFIKYLPESELDSYEESGYLLLEETPGGETIPMIGEGTAEAHRIEDGDGVDFKETRYRNLYRFESKVASEKTMYAYREPFHLYNSNTPFSETTWYLVGLRSEESLFGVREDIARHLMLSLFVALLFGVAGSYAVVRMVTGPINKLEKCIAKSPENEMARFDETGIREVDGLAHVVKSLTKQQKDSENRLIEEKERYRLALESSSDVMFTYDLASNRLDVLNLKEFRGSQDQNHIGESESQMVYPEDLPTVRFLFNNMKEDAVIQFRAKFGPDEEYQWQEMSCRTVFDTDNRRSKIIGRVKNIHQEKLIELKQQEAEIHDPVTGLLSKKHGIEKVTKDMQNEGGVLILADVDRFRELNERFGMVFGDAIMEEIGRLILNLRERYLPSGQGLEGIRAGGDELMIWLPGGTEKEALSVVGQLRKELDEAYGGEGPQVRLSYGICVHGSDGAPFRQRLEEACKALSCAKNMSDGRAVIYGGMTEEQKKTAADGALINEIASVASPDKLNMVSQVFNFFDKSNDVHAIIPVLLVKLGNHYKASRIVVMQTDQEFHTAYVAYQWHEDRTMPFLETIRRYDQKDYRRLEGMIQEGIVHFEDSSRLDQEKQHYLFIPDDCAGSCIPMYDKGVLMGTISFLRRRGGGLWGKAVISELVEITKLIETNINNQRYDLASRAKSDFLSRMSHEIRTPMNAIIGMTEIALQKKQGPEETDNYLRKIESSSKYLLSLINDILDMSKIESGKMKLETGDFSLKEMLEGIDSMIRPQAESRQLKFARDTELIQEWVRGDSLHLNQVLINLLGNALKFTPKDGTVTLTVRQKKLGNYISCYFAVRDTGIGIRKEDMNRIFNSFEQAKDLEGRQYGGTGLGLTISSRFIRMMGGEIEVRSEVGKGSEFYFTLTLQPGEESGENRKEGEMTENEISFDGKRILLVEDNELNMEISQTILAMHGAVVETASNGKEGVDAFLSHEPGYYSLILMDVCMPVMDGLEATRAIRRAGRGDSASVPIIAMSANAFDEDMKKSIESGMNGHLAKPIDVPEFLRVIYRKIV